MVTYYNSFRNPGKTYRTTPNFGIPKGTYNRNGNPVHAICLHTLGETLEEYDALVTASLTRDKAQTWHPSLHYAIGYNGEIHEYVNPADIAWGLWDYQMANFPTPYTPGPSGLFALYPDVNPEQYLIHIAASSGKGASLVGDNPAPFSDVMFKQHVRLIAYLCDLYSITATSTTITTHDQLDTQFSGRCVPSQYPYAALLSAVQTLIAAHGEAPDEEFDRLDLREYVGRFTVGRSRIGSQAFITDDTL